MFFSFFGSLFEWMPLELGVLAVIAFASFIVFFAISLLEKIFTLMQFIFNMLTGILGKVASLFI